MRQTIVIGSVPAGYTAGIYAGRANLNPLLIASSVEAGGEPVKTTEVENGEVHEALSVILATGSAYRKHPR